MSSSAGPDIITNGLVLHLDAADRKSYPGSGTVWRDRSGRGNHANLRNWSSPSTTIISNVKCFNIVSTVAGTGDIQIPNFYTNYHAGINTFTFEWWANSSSTAFDAFNSGACDNPCIAYAEDGDYWNANGSAPITVGFLISSWNQYTLVQNGSLVIAYRNGIQISTRNDWFTAPSASNRSGIIGSRNWANRSNNWFLANLKWYTRALSRQEIQQNFNATKSRFGLL
jgi:hypothetical protein